MKILYKEPGKDLRTMVIPNELGVMQQLVDGLIEPIRLSDKTLCIVNEEGEIKQMDPNFILAHHETISLIKGPAIFCGVNGEEFDSISDDELERIADGLKKGDFVL